MNCDLCARLSCCDFLSGRLVFLPNYDALLEMRNANEIRVGKQAKTGKVCGQTRRSCPLKKPEDEG